MKIVKTGLLVSVILSGCATHEIVDYNRPSTDHRADYAHCNVDHPDFNAHVSSLERTPSGMSVSYRRPVSVTEIYRGDCKGEAYSCNVVRYELTDTYGKLHKVKVDSFSPSESIKIKGLRIKKLFMTGEITGSGLDRRSGNIIACPT